MKNIPYLNYTLIDEKSQYKFITIEHCPETNSNYYFFQRSRDGFKCGKCGCTSYHIDDKRKRKISFPCVNNIKTFMVINYNRFKCNNCNKKFIPPFDCVRKNCTISNESKLNFCQMIKDNLSIKYCARECNISQTSAWNIVSNITFSIDLDNITGLYFDEFKGNADGEKYQLSIFNQDKDLITVLTDRKNVTIKAFLDLLDKTKIKFVVTDLFKQFKSLVEKELPNALYVADAYHYIRQITWAIRDRRIYLFNSDNIKYKSLKNYWKLLAKNSLSPFSVKQELKLQELLDLDQELRYLYDFQTAFRAISNAKSTYQFYSKSYDYILNELLSIGTSESKKLHSTLKNWKKPIIASFQTGLSNGFVEGYNNKTKVLKRVSYGIRKFDNLHKLMHLRFNTCAIISFGI